MKRACKISCTQEYDYKRVPYDTFKNKQLLSYENKQTAFS
jgi:hypothetical protein